MERIARASHLADEAIRCTRELSTELWPCILDDLGLASALRWLSDRYSVRFGFPVAVNGDDVRVIPKVPAAACYRIAEEALANIARHSAARNVVIDVRARRAAVELAIQDDGLGCVPEDVLPRSLRGESLGLAAMRERAVWAGGTFSFDSSPGAGTTVRARIPIRGA
jgi:signal transduction histidine kinase